MTKLALKDFEKFTAKRKVASHDPVFTIGKGGRMSINKFAYEKYFSDHSYVEFYFKPDESIIALKLLKKPTADAYEVRKAVNSNIGAVNATAFFKHHSIDITAKRNTEFLEADDKNGVIFLKIEGAQ